MDDLISRQAAIDAIRALWDGTPTAQHVSAKFDCEDVIQALPSAQPEQKSVLIIKSNVLLKKEQLEAYRKMFMEQKNDGVVLLPSMFEAQYIPDDVDVRIDAAD